MRKSASIFILMALYLLCSSKSCTENDSGQGGTWLQKIEATQDSILMQFELGLPDGMTLRAWEADARQKVADWTDFMKIASDTAVAGQFRDKAAEMARSLFISAGAAQSMEQLSWPVLRRCLDSVRTEKPLSLSADSTYNGSLVLGNGISLSITTERVPKVFGGDTIRAWEVKLGELFFRK